MRNNVRISVADVLAKSEENTEMFIDDPLTADIQEPIDLSIEESEDTEISVDLSIVDTEPISIGSINDEHGRLSDILEALEESTGFSVIPLDAGNIASEVQSLSRHKLYVLNGVRFAMSHTRRTSALQKFQERIIKTLTSGIPFIEDLNTIVTINNKNYPTLALSEDEWVYLMSKFRLYKERLYINKDHHIILEIVPEHAEEASV